MIKKRNHFWCVYPCSPQSYGFCKANCEQGLNISDLCFLIDYFEVGLEAPENVEMWYQHCRLWPIRISWYTSYVCTWLEIFIMEWSHLQRAYFSEPEILSPSVRDCACGVYCSHRGPRCISCQWRDGEFESGHEPEVYFIPPPPHFFSMTLLDGLGRRNNLKINK